jgi:hypothetical protein
VRRRKMELEKILPLDAMRKRSDDDLESITVGSESSAKCKLYYNSKVAKEEELLPRIDIAVAGASYMKRKMMEKGLLPTKGGRE